MLMVRREYKEAAATLEMVRSNARTEDVDDTVKLAYAYQNICYWRKFKELSRSVESIIRRTMGGNRRIASQSTWVAEQVPFSPELVLAAYQMKAVAVMRTMAHLKPVRGRAHDGGAIRTLTVGYASSDFRDHPVGHAMIGVVLMHRRPDFRVVGYSLDQYSVTTNDLKTQAIRERLDKWEGVGELGNEVVAQGIADEGVHILINMNGFTRGSRNEIWALDAAPISATLITASVTMGADFVPYASADLYSTPPQYASGMSEKKVLHPSFHHPSDYSQSYGHLLPGMVARVPSAGRFMFGNFNRLDKLHPATYAVWMQAVMRVDKAGFGMLKSPPDVVEFLTNEGVARGVLPARMVFYDMVQKDEHLLRMSEHDICLDTTTVNGMTTSLDVLYGALPLVSTIGERMNSRFAAAVVTGMGFPELAAPSLKEMEDIAVRYAEQEP